MFLPCTKQKRHGNGNKHEYINTKLDIISNIICPNTLLHLTKHNMLLRYYRLQHFRRVSDNDDS